MVTTLKGVQLFLKVGQGTPRPASYDMMTALSRVQVTDAIEEQDGGFEITFTLGRQKAKDYALVEGELCQPDTRVVIGVSLNGTRATLISGVVTFFQLQPSNQPGMSTLSVMGRSISDMMDRKEKSVSHPNLADSGIVRKLLGDYGQYGIRVQQIKATEDTPHENQFLARQRGTDLQLIQALAKRNAYVFYVAPAASGDGGSMVYWGPENRDATPLPALTMNMGHFTNVTNLSFSQDTQAAVDAKATYFDPAQKKSSDIPPEAEDSKEKSLASTSARRLRTVLLSGTAKYNEKQVAIAGRAAMTPNIAAVKGQGELDITRYPAILKAGNVVGVRGAGSFYDGDYYIEQVTHSIERGKYIQQYQLARDGVGTREQKVR